MATPFAGVQASSVYRHKVGAFEITVLSDGNLALEATLFSGDQARAEKLLEAALLPKVGIPTAVKRMAHQYRRKTNSRRHRRIECVRPHLGPLSSEPRRRRRRPERGRRHCDHAHAPGPCLRLACGRRNDDVQECHRPRQRR